MLYELFFKKQKSPLVVRMCRRVLIAIIFMILTIGAHIAYDYTTNSRLQHDLSVCEGQHLIRNNNFQNAMIEAQAAIHKCSASLSSCSAYMGFYHQCCKDASDGRSSQYKTPIQLYQEGYK